MTVKNKLMAVGAVCAGLLLPVQAAQAATAITATDLNLRVGPGTVYGAIDIIPEGAPVEVFGCLSGWEWCDVDWDGLRGWVAGEYLLRPGTAVYLPSWAPVIGLSVVSFSFDVYHDRHYHGRPWHRERRWSGFWRDRREAREERREERREDAREERREEAREERREEAREERREEAREERRQERQAEQREERREERRALQRQERRDDAQQQRQPRRVERRQERRAEPRQQRQRALQRQERRAEPRQQRQRALQRQERRGGEGRQKRRQRQ